MKKYSEITEINIDITENALYNMKKEVICMDDFLKEEWQKSVAQFKKSLIENKFAGTIYKMMIRCIEWLNRVLIEFGGGRK